jgi:hypothetical protein
MQKSPQWDSQGRLLHSQVLHKIRDRQPKGTGITNRSAGEVPADVRNATDML